MLVFDFSQIGEKLFIIRKRMGLTQAEVAEAAELSTRTYADIERGSVNMRIETVLKICKVLHITPDDIFTTQETTLALKQTQIFEKLNACSTKDKETALNILSAFLQSLEQ